MARLEQQMELTCNDQASSLPILVLHRLDCNIQGIRAIPSTLVRERDKSQFLQGIVRI